MTVAVHVPSDRTVVLHNVSWETYERLLRDVSDCSALRMHYDNGTLEIMSPSQEHEELNRSLAYLVEALLTELDWESRSLGSSTFRRADLDRGFEPDSCFYIQSTSRVEGKRKIDLRVDPPPDLLIEVELTRSAVEKLATYAEVGVPEVWRCDGTSVSILRLASGGYERIDASRCFPFLTAEKLSELLREGMQSRCSRWLESIRSWLTEVGPDAAE